MRGLRANGLFAILDFFYNGETNFFHENLDALLALAEDLRLKGLEGAVKIKKEEILLKLTK